MDEKKIEVVVRQGLKFEKKYPAIGAKIKVGQAEAERLLSLGVVDLPVVAIQEDMQATPSSDADADLMARIAAVTSLEELESMGIDNPSAAVLAAAQQRAAELQG